MGERRTKAERLHRIFERLCQGKALTTRGHAVEEGICQRTARRDLRFAREAYDLQVVEQDGVRHYAIDPDSPIEILPQLCAPPQG